MGCQPKHSRHLVGQAKRDGHSMPYSFKIKCGSYWTENPNLNWTFGVRSPANRSLIIWKTKHLEPHLECYFNFVQAQIINNRTDRRDLGQIDGRFLQSQLTFGFDIKRQFIFFRQKRQIVWETPSSPEPMINGAPPLPIWMGPHRTTWARDGPLQWPTIVAIVAVISHPYVFLH